MSTQASSKLLTAEEFYDFVDQVEVGRTELIDGEVVALMPVSGEHGEIAVVLSATLWLFAKRHNLGSVGVEVGFVLSRDPDNVPAPDVAFVRRSLIPDGGRLPKSGWVLYPPTLAVEVASPSDLLSETQAKIERYLAAGVERVWLVQPKTRTVTVFEGRSARVLTVANTLTSDDAGFDVPGFELPLADLFE